MKIFKKRYIVCLFASILLLCACLQVKYKIVVFNAINNSDFHENVTVMTFNLNASNRTITDEEANQFQELVRKKSPTILCLQECRYKSFVKFRHELDAIYSYSSNQGQKENKRYILYTKYPFRKFRQIPNHKIYAVELKINRKWVAVYSCHLTSNGYSTARREVLRHNGSWISGVGKYYTNISKGIKLREEEATILRNSIDSVLLNKMPVLVIGDLNDFTGSNCLRIIQGKELRDAWCESGIGFGNTYDAWHLKLRIDHILYSDDFSSMRSKVLSCKISDHMPLLTDLRINYE